MFHIELRATEGVNFPYYVMGKAQFRILPFADPWVWLDPQANPYLIFAQDYGIKRYDVDGIERLWYEWLSQVLSCCPDDARESLKYSSSALLPAARDILPEYLSRWPELESRLTGLLSEALSKTNLSTIICRNEQLFGLSYPAGGRETIHFHHFPVTTTQKPGPHFVFGLGNLHRPKLLIQTLERELGLTLLEQILTDKRIASYHGRIEAITKNDHYVQGYGSLLEALNNVIRTVEKRANQVTLDDIPRKPGEQGYWQIAESLFHNRLIWYRGSLVEYVCASLEALK